MILCMLDRYGVTLEDHFQEHCVNSVAQSCLTLCDPMDCSPPGSLVHGILQMRILEWVTIPFPRGSSQPGIEPVFPAPPALADGFLPLVPPGKPVIKPYTASRMLLLSRFSRVRLWATPQTAAHQAPLSLGFSRQEHWSGLPFPSPMHESEK